MANLSVCAFIIPEGVEATSRVSPSVYPLTRMVTNYLALMLVEGSLTRWTEDGHASSVGAVENSTCDCMFYSGLPPLHDSSPGSCLLAFSLRLHLLQTCPLWMLPMHLLGIVTLYVFVGTRGLTFVQTSRYL